MAKITRRRRKLEAERRLRQKARSGTCRKYAICEGVAPITRRTPLISGEALRLDTDRSLDRRLYEALKRRWIREDDLESIRWEVCPHKWMRSLRGRISPEAFDFLRFRGYRHQLWDEYGYATTLGRELWPLLRRRIRPFGDRRQEALKSPLAYPKAA